MINQIHKIAVVTDDIEGAVEYYTKVLGMEEVERFPGEDDDEDFVFLKAGGITFELMPKKTMGTDVGFHHISFDVGDVDEAASELRGKGQDIEVEPFDAGVGGIRLAFFRGPNDVRLQLFNRTQ